MLVLCEEQIKNVWELRKNEKHILWKLSMYGLLSIFMELCNLLGSKGHELYSLFRSDRMHVLEGENEELYIRRFGRHRTVLNG